MKSNTPTSTETHPHFCSGEWEGFYIYNRFSRKDPMSCELHFAAGEISGEGSDPVGSFSWSGKYDTEAGTCSLVKQYHHAHAVIYHGHADENGIWGRWHIGIWGNGGFHIWPKKQEACQEEAVATTTVKKITV